MRRFLPSAVIVVTVGLLAQTAPPDKTQEHPASSCIVSGRVVTADDGTPLRSTRLALVPSGSGSNTQKYATTSNSDGQFVLKDIVPGAYTFIATRSGFVNQRYQATSGSDGGAILSLKPGDKITDVLFRMTRAAVVAGRVTNEDGEAMSQVQVVALRAPSEDEIEDGSASRKLLPVFSSQSDDRGQYRMFGLKPGEYYIKATDSAEPDRNVPTDEAFWVQEILGSEYAPVYYPGVLQASQAQMLSVRAGGEVQADISLQHTKTVEVAGRVIGRDGPAKNTWVQLEPSGVDDFGIDRQSTTDDKGHFRLKSVPPGSYVLAAYQRGEGERRLHATRKAEDRG